MYDYLIIVIPIGVCEPAVRMPALAIMVAYPIDDGASALMTGGRGDGDVHLTITDECVIVGHTKLLSEQGTYHMYHKKEGHLYKRALVLLDPILLIQLETGAL